MHSLLFVGQLDYVNSFWAGEREDSEVRVIAGSARGIVLNTPRGHSIRPTLDRVREALFSILMPRLPGARFLDLFAGTGANGIEALSRGASSAVFVDQDPSALDLVAENLKRTRLAEHARLVRAELPKGLGQLPALTAPCDIIFADPPYRFPQFEGLLEGLREHRLLGPDGILVVEHSREVNLPEAGSGFSRSRTTTYGGTSLSFYLDTTSCM